MGVFFKDIIGQTAIVDRLRRSVDENKLAHALLISGPQGNGKLPIAIALANYLLCGGSGNDACGACPACVKLSKYIHSDLHFVFPVKKKKGGSDSAPVSDDYIAEWRDLLLKNPYFSYDDWLARLDVENQQPMIYERESSEILHKLSMQSREGGWKVVIIWLPEKMKEACSNKLLKIIEEPPHKTLFLLVSEEPDKIIATILSRTQRIDVPRISQTDIENALISRYGLAFDDAKAVAQQSAGNWEKAEEQLSVSEEKALYLDLFMQLMRVAYARNIREMKAWSERVAAMGRERQKRLLEYCQRMIRENFIMNFKDDSMLYMSQAERNFSVRFSPFVNERNIFGIMEELSETQRHIEHNVNAIIVFFYMSLRMIVWIKNR
ncbi:MAG: DNA polymerase III subunit delta [Bacteroidaceae bacterium]|nr:DNA polymerase III subunit delta [Bacteroidaceae bacterium]